MSKYQLLGGLTNGIIIMPDNGVIFLPYNPMRQFSSKYEIVKEIKDLIEKYAEGK